MIDVFDQKNESVLSALKSKTPCSDEEKEQWKKVLRLIMHHPDATTAIREHCVTWANEIDTVPYNKKLMRKVVGVLKKSVSINEEAV